MSSFIKALLSWALLPVIFISCRKNSQPSHFEKTLFKTIERPTTTLLPTDPQVFSSEYSSFIIRGDHSLWAYGNNQFGQLGDGSTTNRHYPVKIMENVKAVAPGKNHTLILKTDSTLWVTGSNSSGQLGLGNLVDQSTPRFISSNVLCIAAGDQHSLYTLYNSREYKYGPFLYAAGSNASGQLGCDCDSTRFLNFRQVSGGILKVIAGSNFTFVIRQGGGYMFAAAGANNLGQLGDGTTINRKEFVTIGLNALDIAAGQAHTLLLKADGTLLGTGYNGFGQLGDGTTLRRNRFQFIADNVWRIAAGSNHTFFISMDASKVLYGIGRNTHGQLGDGTKLDRFFPIPLSLRVKRVAGGGYHSTYTKEDNGTWSSGYNAYGQLGIGNTQSQTAFVGVPFP